MVDEEVKKVKELCLSEMREALPRYRERLSAIDTRLLLYAEDVVRDDIDIHNIDEVLGLRKFLRMLDTYIFSIEDVRTAVYMLEGSWSGNDHLKGGLKLPGMYGYDYYKATPSEVFILCQIYGWRKWVDTTSPNGSRKMLPTEKEGDAGTILDLRNFVTEFVGEIPRKYGKTTIGAFVQFHDFFIGDYDSEGYCCANSEEQAKILFRMVRDMIHQLDPSEKRIRFVETEVNWKDGQARAAFIKLLTAGGKTKDGLKARTCSADEFGASQYTNKKSEMEGLLNVVEGSMGTRREHITVHTSTAGLGLETPYRYMIISIHNDLMGEMAFPMDGQPHERKNDWQTVLLLHPDQWEEDDDSLRSERVIKKVNPHLGVTVQPQYYFEEWAKADEKGDEKRKEVITKLYNVFQNNKTIDWIKPERIMKLQRDMSIDDIDSDDGWMVFCGMDFSMGKDLHAMSYLCYRQLSDGSSEFFADMDAWITEETYESSTISSLYKRWHADGWLHISPGATLEPDLPVKRIMELSEHVNFIRFGYDSYKAKQPINTLSSWIYSLGEEPKDFVRPVKQTYASYNPAVEEFDYIVNSEPALITFSNNPMWVWEFGNVSLDISNDGMDNKKPIKSNRSSDGCNVDNVQCLLSALIMFDEVGGLENS